MKRSLVVCMCMFLSLGYQHSAHGQISERVVDIPTRPDVTQRFLYVHPEKAHAAVILLPGGNGGLDITKSGSIRFLNDNFLVRTRQLFAEQGLAVVVVDAPSDRQRMALNKFRQTPEHVQDIKAVIAWLKQQGNLPVWLVGTSMGTLSASFIATELSAGAGGPDGVVLTSSIVTLDNGRAVPEMPLEKIAVPILVVHHEQDGCKLCSYSKVPDLMQKLSRTPRQELIAFKGGNDRGDPCFAMSHHGFNGLEKEVVGRITDWIRGR